MAALTLLAALVGGYLTTRLALWALKKMGDTYRRIAWAYAASIIFTAALNWSGHDGHLSLLDVVDYALAYAILLAVDLSAKKGRSLTPRPERKPLNL